MRLAATVGIDIPLHGLVYGIDNKLTYFIKRFDRVGQKDKFALEDFSQLSLHSRSTKYKSSMEKVAGVIEDFTTFPLIEKAKLFKRTLFNFIVGNEDMHLKNFSLITRDDIVELSPAYDLINTCIIVASNEEIALPLHGKKNQLKRQEIIDYFGSERLHLNRNIIQKQLDIIESQLENWRDLISISFLSSEIQEKYITLINNRVQRIFT